MGIVIIDQLKGLEQLLIVKAVDTSIDFMNFLFLMRGIFLFNDPLNDTHVIANDAAIASRIRCH